MSISLFFSSRAVKELSGFISVAPDLPSETMRLLALLAQGTALNTMNLRRRSEDGAWAHYKIRIGSKFQKLGKRAGYRGHVVVGPSDILVYCFYMAHDDLDDIARSESEAIAAAMEANTLFELSGRWYTRDEFVEKFMGMP